MTFPFFLIGVVYYMSKNTGIAHFKFMKMRPRNGTIRKTSCMQGSNSYKSCIRSFSNKNMCHSPEETLESICLQVTDNIFYPFAIMQIDITNPYHH